MHGVNHQEKVVYDTIIFGWVWPVKHLVKSYYKIL